VGEDAPQAQLELEELYAKHAEALTRFATGLVGPSDAPDVVSDAVVRCLANDRWLEVRDPRPYLYRAVLNQARQSHRGALRRVARESRLAPSEATVELPDVRPEVLEAVARLSLRQRAVIVLTYWEDLDPAQVATRLQIGEGSVRRHLARARARLREELS
jgi:RNA polymerase sigma-70 factor (ECF subfamily)